MGQTFPDAQRALWHPRLTFSASNRCATLVLSWRVRSTSPQLELGTKPGSENNSWHLVSHVERVPVHVTLHAASTWLVKTQYLLLCHPLKSFDAEEDFTLLLHWTCVSLHNVKGYPVQKLCVTWCTDTQYCCHLCSHSFSMGKKRFAPTLDILGQLPGSFYQHQRAYNQFNYIIFAQNGGQTRCSLVPKYCAKASL